MRRFLFVFALLGPVLAARHGLSAAAGPARLCTANDIAASIANVDHAAGHAQTTIALINRSNHACMLRPYPRLTIVHYTKIVRVPITHYGTGARNILVRPGGSAALAFVWSDLGVGASPCPELNDALAGLPGGGIPLYVPVSVNACLSMEQSPLTSPAPRTVAAADNDNAVAAFDRWESSQDCQPLFLRLTTMGRQSAPRFADGISLHLRAGTNTNTSGHTGQTVSGQDLLFDPSRAIFAASGMVRGTIDTTVCSHIHSAPYGVAVGALVGIKTRRGVTLGASAAAVQRLDGPATIIPLSNGYAAIHYSWKSHTDIHDLVYLFFHSRVMGIDYTDGPNSSALR